MQFVRDDGSVTTDRDTIGATAVSFFQELFQGYSPPPSLTSFNLIQPMLNVDDNNEMCIAPSIDEVWTAIKDMNADSAPGPDGFTGHFYVACWSIIKADLHAAILSFFSGMQLPTSFSATYLTLLPKVPNASGVHQMRPISLCNFCHKIISHILMKRLSKWLPKLVSEDQTGFIPGRSMHSHIVLAHDLVHDLDNGKPGGNVVIKLDMAKAYDRISWSFILQMLRSFGFSEQWCDLIFRCISNCHYSIKWDGKCYGFFRSYRGVRQGDPLSPSLFVLCMEWFSKAMSRAIEEGVVLPFYTRRHAIPISHLLFADDILLFVNGKQSSLNGLMGVIHNFCSVSGQQLNANKSMIIFPENMSLANREEACQITGFMETRLPVTYLGAPLYRGRTLIEYFHHLEARIISRIQGWARSFLSMAARVTLITSVLTSMSIHCIMVLPVPNTIISRINSILSSFLWDGIDGKHRHWIAWDSICTPKLVGGLGVRKLSHIKESLHGKLAWNFIQGESLWARYAASRFAMGRRGSPMWNTLGPLINKGRSLGYWKLGRGDSSAGFVCSQMGLIAPSCIRHYSIREVCMNPGQLHSLLALVPDSDHIKFTNVHFTDMDDAFLCRLTKDGSFSVKAYFEFVQPTLPTLGWATRLWRPWIPPKVSVFLWRSFHDIVPIDVRIMKLGIPLVSKCQCCAVPSVESLQHLLFAGEWAREIWQFLGRLFDRPQIHGLRAFHRVWLRGDRKCFMDCLASGIACCAIWELWKARNASIHRGAQAQCKRAVLRWAPKIVQLIHRPYHSSVLNDLIMSALIIVRPVRFGGAWRPPEDSNRVLDVHRVRDDSELEHRRDGQLVPVRNRDDSTIRI